MKIVCVVVGTHSYFNTLEPCLRRIESAVYYAKEKREIDFHLVFVTDAEGKKKFGKPTEDTTVLAVGMTEGGQAYKEESQLLIANLFQVGFREAVKLGADMCWAVELDVLVPFNGLSCMIDMLEFDNGHYYDVAFCTYPSQSGGMFLGGHGSPTAPIEKDYLPDERNLPDDLKKRLEEAEERMKNPLDTDPIDPNERAESLGLRELMEEVDKCPPKGNVFELNSKRWRRRGWLDSAYPAVGKGAVLESEWTGMGCNLLSRRALSSSAFDGYDGRGTQDLFLNWRRWKAEGMRFCVITHAVCEHVVGKKDGQGGKVHAFAHHEQVGEMKGHLRVQHRPFYAFAGGDKFDPENDGIIKPFTPTDSATPPQPAGQSPKLAHNPIL